jgi:hypothetical protein
VNLPPGCEGLNLQDGTRYSARKGGAVTVSDEHAAAVARFSGGDAAILDGRFRAFGGTRNGRWCQPCRRLWNAWNDACVKCGGETVPEAEMPAPAPALPSGCTPVAAGISGPLPDSAA